MATQSWATIAAGIPYGWQILYATKIEGFPFIWVEKGLGATDPTGYTAHEALILDESDRLGAVADTKSGVARSYDLSFRLLRTSITQGYFSRPNLITSLTADLAWDNTTSASVKDTTGWPSSGTFFLGREGVAYSFKTGTTFNGLTRGQPNSEWRAYDHDEGSGIATYVTDNPLFWRGRLVELYAIPVDPYGVIQGTDLLDGASMVWRGHIHQDPIGSSDGWQLVCRSQDRRLSQSFGVEASGKGTWSIISDPKVVIDPEWTFTLTIQWDLTTPPPAVLATFELRPFTSFTYGDELRMSQCRVRIAQEFVSVVGAFGTPESIYICPEFKWRLSDGWIDTADGISREWQAYYVGSSKSAEGHIHIVPAYVHTIQGFVTKAWSKEQTAEKNPNEDWIALPLWCQAPASGIGALTVELDEGAPDDLPTSGVVFVEGNDQKITYRYDDLAIVGDGLGNKVHLYPANDQPGLLEFAEELLSGETDGQIDVTFVNSLGPGVPKDLMRKALLSSGRGDNDPTYDTEPRGAGYDLDAVDTGSFDTELDGHWSTTLIDQTLFLEDAQSFVSLWGELIALSDRNVVSKPSDDGSSVDLTVVQTSLADTGTAALTITDAHLLVADVGGQPVRQRPKARAPNVVSIKTTDALGKKSGTVIINDITAQRAEGTHKWGLTAYGLAHDDVAQAGGSWARARFEDAKASRLFEIDVVPWLAHDDGTAIEVGDAVQLDSNHFNLWDPADGSQGYTGPARVLGKQLRLRDYQLTLTLALAGLYVQHSLAPSVQVVSWNGTAAAPTLIRVSGDYYELFNSFLPAGGNFDLVAYEPSLDDATTDSYRITAVALVSTLTELTVGAITGAPVLTTDWYLTIPIRTSANDAQNRHLHTDTEGAAWR
jgi:hypothetical protein